MTRPKHLKKIAELPKLESTNNVVTSPHDVRYNCIAFAAGVTNRKFWPRAAPDYFWPPAIPDALRLESFIALYESYGFSLVEDDSGGQYQAGVEQIAIWAKNGAPTHAARQIGPGKWASKLGDSYDIEHLLEAVSGGIYGQIVAYLRKRP